MQWEGLLPYQGQVFQDLNAVARPHMGDVVEVGGVGNELIPHLWVPQHLSAHQKDKTIQHHSWSLVRNLTP